MSDFGNIKFEFECKHSLNKYKNIVEEYLLNERNNINAVFKEYNFNEQIKKVLEKSNYEIKIIIDTKKPHLPESGFLFGCLGLTKEEILIFILPKDISSLYAEYNAQKEISTYEILKTLIHELGHLYIKDEIENKEFTRLLVDKLNLIEYLKYSMTDLYYLQQVGTNRIKAMNRIGIFSLNQISEENRQKLKDLPGSSDWHVNKWIEQARAIKNNELVFKKTKTAEKLINAGLIIFDVETDDFQTQIFLITSYNTTNKEIKQFFDKNNEKKLLHDFIDYINQFRNNILVSYSNNYFEDKMVRKRLASNDLEQVRHQSIDLGVDIQDIVIGKLSSSDYNVKHLSKFFGYRQRTNLTGTDVGVLFGRYLEKKEECNWDKIKIYNEDDVLAIKLIIEKITENLC